MNYNDRLAIAKNEFDRLKNHVDNLSADTIYRRNRERDLVQLSLDIEWLEAKIEVLENETSQSTESE